jgi:hypothetical protein
MTLTRSDLCVAHVSAALFSSGLPSIRIAPFCDLAMDQLPYNLQGLYRLLRTALFGFSKILLFAWLLAVVTSIPSTMIHLLSVWFLELFKMSVQTPAIVSGLPVPCQLLSYNPIYYYPFSIVFSQPEAVVIALSGY